MFCSKCGNPLSDDAFFCSCCGNKVSLSHTSSVSKIVHLICKKCGGTMSVEKDRPVIRCPYCGKQDLVIEEKDVAMQRIRSNAYRDVKYSEHKAHKEIEVERIKAKKENESEKRELGFAMVFFIICIAFFVFAVVFGKRL